MCCQKAPCPFGEWDAERHQCKHLRRDATGRYECGIAEEIVTQPGWEIAPAFGAGCCMTLFNSERQRIIRAQKEEAEAQAEAGNETELPASRPRPSLLGP